MEKNKKTKAISIRLTEEEMSKIEEIAKQDYDYPSSWIRKKILGIIENENM